MTQINKKIAKGRNAIDRNFSLSSAAQLLPLRLPCRIDPVALQIFPIAPIAEDFPVELFEQGLV